jgi:hypothetical protein
LSSVIGMACCSCSGWTISRRCCTWARHISTTHGPCVLSESAPHAAALYPWREFSRTQYHLTAGLQRPPSLCPLPRGCVVLGCCSGAHVAAQSMAAFAPLFETMHCAPNVAARCPCTTTLPTCSHCSHCCGGTCLQWRHSVRHLRSQMGRVAFLWLLLRPPLVWLLKVGNTVSHKPPALLRGLRRMNCKRAPLGCHRALALAALCGRSRAALT